MPRRSHHSQGIRVNVVRAGRVQDFVCTACKGKGWTPVTDAQTGTMYARCNTCERHWLASRRGYVDWHAGIFMDSRVVTGSEWTKTATSTYFGDPSEVTHVPVA